jgi:transposase InsO family protein
LAGTTFSLFQTIRQTAMKGRLPETINGLYKAELVYHRGPWKTIESLELATLTWVTWFNHTRLLEPIGNIPPAEAEERYYSQSLVQATTACT